MHYTDRTLQLVNGTVSFLYFGVENATCFKWLQIEFLLRSTVEGADSLCILLYETVADDLLMCGDDSFENGPWPASNDFSIWQKRK